MSDDGDDIGGGDEAGAPAWMATFSDLMSLLLTFFVLLMSFAILDQRRFSAMTGSMKDAFGVQRLRPGTIEALSSSIISLSDTESTPMLRVIDVPTRFAERDQSLVERIKMTLRERQIERLVQVESTPAGVVMRIPGKMLFDPGSAELRSESVLFLHEIAEMIRATPGEVSVDGHTDASPTAKRHRSNWDLSAARAVSALSYLVEVEEIPVERLRATAYAASRPLTTDAMEQELNRRVEFVFLRDPTEGRVGAKDKHADASPKASEETPEEETGA